MSLLIIVVIMSGESGQIPGLLPQGQQRRHPAFEGLDGFRVRFLPGQTAKLHDPTSDHGGVFRVNN